MTESEVQKLAELLDEKLDEVRRVVDQEARGESAHPGMATTPDALEPEPMTSDEIHELRAFLGERFEKIDDRLESLDQVVRKNGVTIEEVHDEVKVVAERVTGVVEEMAAMESRLSDRIEGVSEEVQTLAGDVWPGIEDHEERLRSLER